VYKLYHHIDQFRGMSGRASSALQPMYRQFIYEVIPFVLVSIVMNAFILSGVRSNIFSPTCPYLTVIRSQHFGPYSICFIYFDFSFSVRVSNDLVYMSRLSRPDNIWGDGSILHKFTGSGPGMSTFASSAGAARSEGRPFVATVTSTTTVTDKPSAYWNEAQSVPAPYHTQHYPMSDMNPRQ
jgi:hypothetical protein